MGRMINIWGVGMGTHDLQKSAKAALPGEHLLVLMSDAAF